MRLLFLMMIPLFIILGIGKIVDYINPKMKSDDYYVRHIFLRKVLIFVLLWLVSVIMYFLERII